MNDLNLKREKLKACWNHIDIGRPCYIINPVINPENIPDTDDLCKFWTDKDFVIKREMALIDNSMWLGEAIPYHYVNFGSVPISGCFGEDLYFIDKESTYNKPFIKDVEEILDLDFDYNNKWWKLITDITERSAKLAQGHHFVTPVALSGITDIISMMCGVEPLLYLLMDNPNGVKKSIEHLIVIWKRLFAHLNTIIEMSNNEGSIGWPGVWAPGTTFPLQEDFSYMLSKNLFKEFCMPAIESLADCMDYPYYHLDGKESIKFVDELVSIEKLKMIQWVPGAGHEELYQWHDLIKYILSKGKSVHAYAKEEEVEPLIKAVGTKGLVLTVEFNSNDRALRFYEKNCR